MYVSLPLVYMALFCNIVVSILGVRDSNIKDHKSVRYIHVQLSFS